MHRCKVENNSRCSRQSMAAPRNCKPQRCAPMTCRPCCCPSCCRCYCRRRAQTFSVIYLANGGTGEFIDRNVRTGSSYAIKSDTDTGISRSGFNFNGWNTEADGSGTSYQPGDNINITGNVRLYAQWTPVEPVTFTVNYDDNGGTGQYSDNVAAGTSYVVKSEAETGITRPGYNFYEWNTAATGTGTSYPPGSTITVNNNLTLYAQWTPDEA